MAVLVRNVNDPSYTRGVAICQDQNKATRYIPVKEDIKN